MRLVRRVLVPLICAAGAMLLPDAVRAQQENNGLTGHLGTNVNRAQPDPAFMHGMSLYSSVYTLNASKAYWVQLGAGFWITPDNRSFTQPLCPVGTYARDNWPERGPTYRDVYQTLEGGVGQWVNWRFPSADPKFRINGVPDCYTTQVGTPTATFHGDPLKPDKLGLAQLSNKLVLPPDGVTLAGAQTASLLGYGWFALPLIPAYTSPAGVETGDQSWTLFFNTANFKGPVAFFTPEAWSYVNATDKTGVGRGNDARPGYSYSVALEVGITPMFTASSGGTRYRRIPRVTFPVNTDGQAVLLQDVRSYSKQAIWTPVDDWMRNGTVATQFDSRGLFIPTLDGSSQTLTLGGSPVISDPSFSSGPLDTRVGTRAFGIKWATPLEAGVLPEYFREEGGNWRPVPGSAVPADTGLHAKAFATQPTGSIPPVSTSAASPWSSTRWSAGPFQTRLFDGSVVEYVWYKFIEQPAIYRLGLGSQALQRLQAFAESLHGQPGSLTFAPPSTGALATLDPALFVTPPAGLEKGYVPIAIRQIATTYAPTHNYIDLWWDPREPGWGINLSHQGDIVFATLYTYDSAGAPLWLYASDARKQADGSFLGTIYRARGPAFDASPWSASSSTPAGSMRLVFTTQDSATLSYSVDGLVVAKSITRYRFSSPTTCTWTEGNLDAVTNYQDLWWNPAEPGWGVNIAHQGDILFATLYTYDSTGAPLWLSLSNGARTAPGKYSGSLYRSTGPAFNTLPWSAISLTPVGTMSFSFDRGTSGTLAYTVNGVSVTKAIQRFAFSSPRGLCASS